jgi:transposase-like protein
MAEMALKRGLLIHASCIWRWVQVYGPELDKRCRAHLKRTNKSYRVDETYIRIEGQDRYLYRAVDSTGQPIDFRSPPNAMLRQPSDSSVRRCSTQPIRSLG